jgi:hypothetical protein
MDMNIFTPTSTQPRSTMSPSAVREFWRTPAARCISSFPNPFWTKQQLRIAFSNGLRIMKRQLIPSTRLIARILTDEYCCLRFLGSAIAWGYRYWPFGFPGSRTDLPTTYLIYQHIWIDRMCTEPWQQSVARKFHSKYMMSVNGQYVRHIWWSRTSSILRVVGHLPGSCASTHDESSKSVANILSAIRIFCSAFKYPQGDLSGGSKTHREKAAHLVPSPEDP